MGGKMSRDKGKRAERQVIELLQPVVNEVFQTCGKEPPVLKRNTLQSDGGGSDIAGLPWLAIEVKHHETLNVSAWWAQTLRQCSATQDPVLIYRSNRTTWRVRMFGWCGEFTCGHRAAVDIHAEDFLRWFRNRLVQRLEEVK